MNWDMPLIKSVGSFRGLGLVRVVRTPFYGWCLAFKCGYHFLKSRDRYQSIREGLVNLLEVHRRYTEASPKLLENAILGGTP